ncbi:phosphatase PAP2 family protein [Streptomyces sp. NPDC088354]|uniref:phosphatase PAP2 family protein n=1 Tax=Streptomyces sp. NPDC088354 TaxID=3365856 RepID=UPI0038087F1C
MSGGFRHLARSAAASSRLLARTGIVLAAVVGYFAVRGLTHSSRAEALRNAARIEGAEHLLRLDREFWLQDHVVHEHAVTRILNWIYIFGHWPVIALTLIWLLTRHPDLYVRAAGAMLVSGTAGLIAFAAFPVAPPRLAGLGMTDTVTQQSAAYRLLQPPAFTNQYAAMPSLHVGWNLLMTLAILAATRRAWLRVMAVTLTVAMDTAVVLTANHYLLDALAGAALAHIGWYAAGQFQHHRDRRGTSTADSSGLPPSGAVLPVQADRRSRAASAPGWGTQ